MEEQGKKWLAIGFAVVSIAIVIVVFSKTFFGGSGTSGSGDGKVYLLCKSCSGFEITLDEYRDMMNTQPGGMAALMGGPMLLICPKCNQKSCMVATKCQKCENIFIPYVGRNQAPNSYPDKCPKCGYSPSEERDKEE